MQKTIFNCCYKLNSSVYFYRHLINRELQDIKRLSLFAKNQTFAALRETKINEVL